MKKLAVFALILSLFSCTREMTPVEIPSVMQPKATEVYINGSLTAEVAQTKTLHGPIPDSTPVEGKYRVYYYIRIDGNIPGSDAGLYPAEDYFPRTIFNASTKSNLNMGYAKADIEWRSNSLLTKYIFATDGIAVNNALVTKPSIENLIAADEHPDDDFSELLPQLEDLHVIWYVCKLQNDGWHVDGILTKKEITNIKDTSFGDDITDGYEDCTDDAEPEPETPVIPDVPETPHINDGIEVNIDQQEHNDWDEIKTSIHIRTDADYIDIRIPIEGEFLSQKDDVAIRTYEAYYTIEETEYPITVDIIYNPDNVTIRVTNMDVNVINSLMETTGDGITIEVHLYPIGLSKMDIWDKIKNSTVTAGYGSPDVSLLITSAYY